MPVQPPVPQILGTEHPWLAIGAVGDGGAGLVIAGGIAGIEPAEEFSAFDVRLQIGAIIDRGRACDTVEVAGAIAPIGERRVPVDADEIDIAVGPERIEMEEDIVRAVGWPITVVVRPIGGVAHLHAAAENALHIGGEGLQPRHCREVGRAVTHRTERAELRSDQEGVDGPGIDRVHRSAELGVVQDEPAQAPFGRAGIAGRYRIGAGVYRHRDMRGQA